MAAFFLHISVFAEIRTRHEKLFSGGGDENELESLGVKSSVYEVASTGLAGKLEDVKKMSVYEFYELMEYFRIKSDGDKH